MAVVTGVVTGVATEATEAIVLMGVGEEGGLEFDCCCKEFIRIQGPRTGILESEGHDFYLILTIV